MYSDCLDLNRWYHGKSGYIAIIRLTQVWKNVKYLNWLTRPTGRLSRKTYRSTNAISVLCCCQQGRVKKVLENYTQNFTTPTVGFDCHVSEQLPTVSSKTSSFLAFERTQVRFCLDLKWRTVQCFPPNLLQFIMPAEQVKCVFYHSCQNAISLSAKKMDLFLVHLLFPQPGMLTDSRNYFLKLLDFTDNMYSVLHLVELWEYSFWRARL